MPLGAAVAIWLVWPESLARGLTGAPRALDEFRGLIRVEESSRTCIRQRALDKTGAQLRDRSGQINHRLGSVNDRHRRAAGKSLADQLGYEGTDEARH
jgi:hypothetical protein